MSFSKIHQLIPFRRFISLLIVFSISLQVIIIAYNHLSGLYNVTGPFNFFIRLIYNSVMTFIGSLMVTYPDLFVIQYLNKRLPWGRKTLRRVLIQVLFSLAISTAGAVLITLLSDILIPYDGGPMDVMVDNILILAIINLLLMITLEAWIFFIEGSQSKKKAEDLEKELTEIRFETLKNQLNPHFMFNSLNVLSGLINTDIKKAQQFIDEFALVYRYVLETLEKPVVSAGEELDFVRSYLFLQKLRYGDSLQADYKFDARMLSSFIPPLSVQVLAENAIKHNIINKEKPLTIWFYSEPGYLVVKNRLQPKSTPHSGPGTGQINLSKRYQMIGNRLPGFYVDNNFYIAKIPVIENEQS